MRYIIIALVIVVIIIVVARVAREPLDALDDIVIKSASASANQSTIADASREIIPAIAIDPSLADAPADAPADASSRAELARASSVYLTYDAALARRAMLTARDKRTYDAIANRTSDYWRPIFEEELQQCDNRDWWDSVEYPMNDTGLAMSQVVPESVLRSDVDFPDV